MDPALYVQPSNRAQADLAAAQALIDRYHRAEASTLRDDDVRDLLERLHSTVGRLEHADSEERRQYYQHIGLHLAYQRDGDHEKVLASLGVEFSRVGGGT